MTLVALPGQGLLVGPPEPIAGSFAGRAFLGDALIEQPVDDGVRLFVPLLDGTDRVGVIAFTAASPSEDDRRLARRFAGLVADVLVTKSMYTDLFFQARRRRPMSFDAMGHGLDAASMATVGVAAYRHARRGDVDLPDLYASMDRAISAQFDQDRFVTAQMARLDVNTGQLQWVNAGHPHPLLLRDRRVVRTLDSPTTLPVGIGGATPHVTEESLEPGDRVLFFTDGIIEERLTGGELFGEERLIDQLERAEQGGGPVQQTVRQLSHALMRERGGATSDDATLFLLEWRAGTVDHLARFEGSGDA